MCGPLLDLTDAVYVGHAQIATRGLLVELWVSQGCLRLPAREPRTPGHQFKTNWQQTLMRGTQAEAAYSNAEAPRSAACVGWRFARFGVMSMNCSRCGFAFAEAEGQNTSGWVTQSKLRFCGFT